jgi:flagellin-like hook-associated protein FlgL
MGHCLGNLADGLAAGQLPTGDSSMVLGVGAGGIQGTLLNNNARTNRITNQATERLSTGLRINHGRDDPAGLIGAEQLRGDLIQISAESKVINSQRRQNHIQQSGRQTASDVLQEVRGLFVQASAGTSSAEERAAIQLQVDSSLNALDSLGSTTGFALPESLDSLRSGESAYAVDGDTTAAVKALDDQLAKINLASAAAGAYEKYTLDVDQRLAEAKAVATASSLSQLEDANYAQESSNLVKGQILTEASIKTMALSQQLKSDQISALFNNL